MQAQPLVKYVETKVDKGFDNKKDSLATKEDLLIVRQNCLLQELI